MYTQKLLSELPLLLFNISWAGKRTNTIPLKTGGLTHSLLCPSHHHPQTWRSRHLSRENPMSTNLIRPPHLPQPWLEYLSLISLCPTLPLPLLFLVFLAFLLFVFRLWFILILLLTFLLLLQNLGPSQVCMGGQEGSLMPENWIKTAE